MANLSAKLLIVALLIGCAHQYKKVETLDTTKVKDERKTTNTHRGFVVRTDPYTDKEGNVHPGTTFRGPVDTTTIFTGHFVEKTHWYSFLKSTWKFGLPWWLWIVGSFAAVCIVIYVFHRFTIIGRIQALWSKLRDQSTSDRPPNP